MLDFDNPALTQPVKRVTTEALEAPVEKVKVTPIGPSAGYKAKDVSAWNWDDLRDYIMGRIEDRHGPQVRDALKESGIIKSFISRWGIERAFAIAEAAFDVHDGMWRSGPITITRFAKGSDQYFAQVIADNL